ncbi:MAG: GYF domain-containing protein [Verrucomicrobiota bacterium]|nr:GYF domain-containing protein [Verrucomicrobiota bacterium]
MYHIIGGDDQKHGPVDEAKIREWITECRANAQSMACRVGENQWRRLSEFTEFAPEFGVSAPVAPPLAAPHQEQGDATGGIIPYKNKQALIGYYMSVGGLIMMCIPVIGLIYTISVVVLGVKGLKNAKSNPQVKGQVHSWIAIIGGSLETIVAVIPNIGMIGAMLG